MASIAKTSPRAFHGWWIVVISFFGSFITAGTGGYIFGQFINPLAAAFAWSVATVSSMSFVRSITSIFVTPVVGRITDRIGSRPVMIAGALLCGGVFITVALIDQPIVFYVLFSMVVSVGYTLLGGVPAQTVVTHWFRRRRGMALALSSMGISVGGIIMVPLAQWLIDSYGWRTTLGVFGVGILLLMFPPVWLFMRDHPESMGQTVDGDDPLVVAGSAWAVDVPNADQHDERRWTTPQILRSGNFWKQSIGYMFAFGMLQVMLIYQFPFIVNRGFSNQTAALIVSGYALFAALGRFSAGWLADRADANALAVASIWLAAIGVIILVLANDLPAIWLYAIVGGAGIGGLSALQSVVTAQLFGRRSFGTVSGLQNPLNQVAAAVAVPFAGFMYDATGTYNLAMLVVVAAAMAASVTLLMLPRTSK